MSPSRDSFRRGHRGVSARSPRPGRANPTRRPASSSKSRGCNSKRSRCDATFPAVQPRTPAQPRRVWRLPPRRTRRRGCRGRTRISGSKRCCFERRRRSFAR